MSVTTQDALAVRLDALRKAIAAKDLDALLLTNITNIGYMTGFSGSSAYGLVTAEEAILITDGRYAIRVREEAPNFTPIIAAGSGGYIGSLQETLTARPAIQKLGFEADHMTVSQHERFVKDLPEGVSLVPASGLVEVLRLTKDAIEVAKTRRAIDVAQSAFLSVKHLLRPGVSEREFAAELDFAMRKNGAQKTAFESIVASGPQSAHPHHSPNGRIFEVGDFITIDWGAEVDGYCSDITRTVFIGSDADVTPKHREVYATVLEAQRMAIAAIAPGKNGQEIDAIARDHIAARGYGEAFAHSLGHSLGRTVHDGPGFSTRSQDFILKPGMIMTVEPGVYLEGWGGLRIEEDVLVTEDGCETLTSLPNEFEALGG
ncbi:MAG: Xaa-Pro peptidase family protein [Capsulimonas sp.]|uniref:M24 family metallopeptidase n=1 Tax=Capsulimonas sp. TaxID=2494211 RepID=UPI0032644ADD